MASPTLSLPRLAPPEDGSAVPGVRDLPPRLDRRNDKAATDHSHHSQFNRDADRRSD